MYTPFTAKHALSNTVLIDLLFLFIAELSAYKYLNKKISLMSFGFFFGQRPKPIFQPHKKKIYCFNIQRRFSWPPGMGVALNFSHNTQPITCFLTR